ncbi:MAG: PF20097 family protein [Candidatus Syntropharchaeales archaeon]
MEKGFIISPVSYPTPFNWFLGIGWYSGEESQRNVSLTDPNFDILLDMGETEGGRAWIRAYRCEDCREVIFNYHIEGSRHYPYPKSGGKG